MVDVLLAWFLNTDNLIKITELIIIAVGAIFAVLAIRQNTKANQTNLLHDMAKEEVKNKRRILHLLIKHGTKMSKKTQDLFENEMIQHLNYYEHLSYLINSKKINEEDAKRLWKGSIIKIYDDMKPLILSSREKRDSYYIEFEMLYKKWKEDKNGNNKTKPDKKSR